MFFKLNYIFFIFIAFISCKKKENYDAISIIGHAGNGLHISSSMYHDNSREAIELALSTEGCDGVEIDVQMTKDGVLFLYHDVDLNSETNSIGCINSKNSFEMENINYSTAMQENLIQINLLNINYLNDKTIFLDTRHFNECESKLVNFTQFKDALNSFKVNLVKAKLYVLTNNELWVDSLYLNEFSVIFSAETNQIAATIPFEKIEGFMFKNHAIEKSDVSFYHAKNKKIIIFEVRSPKGIREALDKFPDFLVTDDIRATLIEKYP